MSWTDGIEAVRKRTAEQPAEPHPCEATLGDGPD